MAATVVSFGEWLPDMPALGNPGLTTANNVVADVGFYRPYKPLQNYAATLPGVATALFNPQDDTSLNIFYGATTEQLFVAGVGTSNFTARSASLSAASLGLWAFAQYDNLVFAVNGDNTVYHTIRATSNFLTSAAPAAAVVGVFKRFVIVGDLIESGTTRPNVIRWCAIDQPTNWPTPNSATAIATQAGEQVLNKTFGRVNAISAGDQSMLVFQEYGITRVIYAGPPVVFQFDEIDSLHGASRLSTVRVGGMTYFYSNSVFGGGFYASDGVGITPIGDGKVNNTFKGFLNSTVRGFYNASRQTVNWSFSSSENTFTTVPNKIYSFHIPTARWTSSDEQLLAVDTSVVGAVIGPYAFDENNIVSIWNLATAGSATIATGDLELNPGGRAFVDGVKPNVESSATAPAVTVRVGARNDLGTTPSYTATTTPTTRTGFADMRVDAKYHRAEVQIVGNFDKVTGIEFKAIPTGET